MYECHGWTDKFQLFQFSFSSITYSRKSVRPYGQAKKNVTDKQVNTHDPIRSIQWQEFALEFINVTDVTIQNKHAVLLTLRSVSMQCNTVMQYNAIQASQ
jgi:hypothetical protein